MIALYLQTLLLILAAFLVGAMLACLLRRSSSRPSAALPGSAAHRDAVVRETVSRPVMTDRKGAGPVEPLPDHKRAKDIADILIKDPRAPAAPVAATLTDAGSNAISAEAAKPDRTTTVERVSETIATVVKKPIEVQPTPTAVSAAQPPAAPVTSPPAAKPPVAQPASTPPAATATAAPPLAEPVTPKPVVIEPATPIMAPQAAPTPPRVVEPPIVAPIPSVSRPVAPPPASPAANNMPSPAVAAAAAAAAMAAAAAAKAAAAADAMKSEPAKAAPTPVSAPAAASSQPAPAPTPQAAQTPITPVKPVDTAPAVAKADDLKRIRAITPELERALATLGIRTYADMARWQKADVDRVNSALGFRNRVEQENWIEQAQILASGGMTSYAKDYARGFMPSVIPTAAVSARAPAAAPTPVTPIQPASAPAIVSPAVAAPTAAPQVAPAATVAPVSAPAAAQPSPAAAAAAAVAAAMAAAQPRRPAAEPEPAAKSVTAVQQAPAAQPIATSQPAPVSAPSPAALPPATQPQVADRAAFASTEPTVIREPARPVAATVPPPPAAQSATRPVTAMPTVTAAPVAPASVAPASVAPSAVTAPAANVRDDLVRIRTINAEIAKTLNVQGVTRYHQIASWNRSDVERFDRLLGAPGRIERENWIEQAKILGDGGSTDYARAMDRANAAPVAASPATPPAPTATAPVPPVPPATTTTVAPAAAMPPPASTVPPPGRSASQHEVTTQRPAPAPTTAPTPAAPTAPVQTRFVEPPVSSPRPDMAKGVVAAAATVGSGSATGPRTADLSSLVSVRSPHLRDNSGAQNPNAPRVLKSSQPDDLKRIRGIGVLIEKRLNQLGVTSYDQIANWTSGDIDRYNNQLDFKGRIERESWVEQARILSSGGQTEFSRRLDRGGS